MLDVRSDALAQAAAAIDAGRPAVLVVIGDAGIGKSTLVGRISDHARASGVPIVSTRWSGDAASPPMWAWSVLFRNWAEVLGPITALEEVHPLVRRLAPDVVEAAGMVVPDAPVDELSARLLTGDALGRLFARRGTPTLLVLEDLHHAPDGGLGLLSSLAPAALTGPVVLVATSRAADPAADLLSLPQTRRVELGPLDRAAAVALVESVNPTLDERAVQAIADRAEGNPFFMSELARLAGTSGATSTTTPGLREVVLQRVDALGDGAREVLVTAALLGRKPEIDVVGAATGDYERLDAVLDDAEQAGLIAIDGPVLRFGHDLVRDALVDSLGAREARRVHGRLADALRDTHDADPFQFAHHLLASGAETAEAADAGARAAAVAASGGANEEAVRWADRALSASRRLPDAPERARRLDLVAGRALIGLSDFMDGKARLVRVAEGAISAGDGPTAAEALLSIGAERLRHDEAYDPPLGLMAETIELVADDPRWRCRLVGRSADLQRFDGGRVLAQEALDSARASGEPDLIVTALGRVLIGWHDNDAQARRASADELLALSATSSAERQFEALACRCVVLLEAGEIEEVRRLLPVINAGVLRAGLPAALSFEVTEALLLFLQGRFDEADAIMTGLVSRASEDVLPERVQQHAILSGVIADLRGAFGPLLETLRMYASRTAGTPGEVQVQCLHALIAAHAGDSERAREAIDRVFAIGVEQVGYFSFGLPDVMVASLTEAVCLTGAVERLDELEPRMRRWAGRMAVGGMAPFLALGSADYVLALIAQLRGDIAAAQHHAAAAVAFNRRLQALPFEAKALVLAAELAQHDDDAAHAIDAARAAAKLALRFEMVPTAERAARVLASLGAAPVRGASVGGSAKALVFTDIENSTQSAAALGDAAWMERLRDHDQTVRKLVANHGGREVKHLGDGFMLTFPTAGSAVAFARELQAAFAAGVVRVRAGIHVGPVIEEDGDVFGTTVNVAARLSGAARGGETLVSDTVLSLVPTPTGEPRSVALKGVDEPMQLHPLA